MNFAAVLSRVAAREGGKPAVIERAESVSYRQLWRGVEQAARHLSAAGVQQGDRVAIALPNGSSFLEHLFGAMMLRAIAVPVRYDYGPFEVAHILQDCRPKVFLSDAEWLRERSWASGLMGDGIALVDAHSRTRRVRDVPPCNWTLATHEPAVIGYVYTGVGQALGAVHTHRSCTLAGIAYNRHIGIRGDDRILFTLPMPNAFTLAGCVFAPLLRGATLVIEHDFAPKVLLATIARAKVTIVTGVPDIFKLMASFYHRTRHDISSLRLMITGGAHMSEDSHREVESKMRVPMVQGYGLTESFPVLCNPPDKRNRPGSLGLAGRDVRVRIADGRGRDLPAGSVGEIWVSCPFLMQGYYGQPERTKRVLRNGWLRTGDLGHIDSEGYVYFDGMRKKLINLHGNKIDPVEVREVLLSHPAIKEVEIVAEGNPSYNGRVIKLRARVWLRGRRNLDGGAIRQFCRERMAAYKVPAFLEVVR